MQTVKRVVEDVTHGQRRHALAVQLVNVGAHVQQEVDHVIMAVHLPGPSNEKSEPER